MNIYIDIDRLVDSCGKATLYYPRVHWNLDDEDSLNAQTMNKMKEEIQEVCEKWLCCPMVSAENSDQKKESENKTQDVQDSDSADETIQGLA